MKKMAFPSGLTSKIIMFLICSMSSFFCSPQLLAQNHRNCAELQKVLNDRNPGTRFQGFEKAKMQFQRSMPFQSVYASSFFCDGGTYVETHQDGIRRICSGYMLYYVSPYSNDQGLTEKYYAGPGNYLDRWDSGDRVKRYCRQQS